MFTWICAVYELNNACVPMILGFAHFLKMFQNTLASTELLQLEKNLIQPLFYAEAQKVGLKSKS